MLNKTFTRQELQDHIFKRLKEQSLISHTEFRKDVLEVALDMAKCGMINYERGCFNCFGLRR